MTVRRDADIALPAARADRAVTLAHRLEYAALKGLLFFFRIIGVDAASALAGRFMRLVGPLLRPISRRGEDNLRLIFPDWSEAEIRRTIAGVWENLGRTAAEFAHLEKFTPGAPGSRVEVVGADRLKDMRDSGRPHLFVSGHFANWETMAILLHGAGVDSALVYRAANNPLADRLIIERRARVMTRLQIPKSRRSVRAMIDAMASGRSLAMLVDQKLNDGVAAPFLGREAMTSTVTAKLSLKFGAPIVTASVERVGRARLRIAVHEPLDYAPTGDAARDALALTTMINERLEKDIRARPEQWLWLHRRWSKPRAR